MCATCMQPVLCVCQVGDSVSWYKLLIMQKICTRLAMYNNSTVVLECLWFCIELYHRSDKSQAWNLYEQTLDPLAIVRLITFMHGALCAQCMIHVSI